MPSQGPTPRIYPAATQEYGLALFRWHLPLWLLLVLFVFVGIFAVVALGIRQASWHRYWHWVGPPQRARRPLCAIASSMITFIGLVFSVVVLVVQFDSTAFSPRMLWVVNRDASQ